MHADYEAFQAIVVEMKASLDVSEAKWLEYEEQYNKCVSWLERMEPLIAEYREKVDDLLSKRNKLEEFQSTQLQNVFETQSEFSRLNLKAQLLLETYTDNSISKAVEKLTARYNATVIAAKEVLHLLEQRYQEHQQLQYLIGDANEQLESFKDRHDAIRKAGASKIVDELNSKVAALKQLLSQVEQASNSKVGYIVELTDKVVKNTSAKGEQQVRDETDGVKTEYAALIKLINETNTMLADRINYVQEFEKVWEQFNTWLSNDLIDKYKQAMDECDTRKETMAKLVAIEQDILSKGNLITKFRNYEDKEERVKQLLDEQLHPFMAKLTSSIAKLDAEIKSEET